MLDSSAKSSIFDAETTLEATDSDPRLKPFISKYFEEIFTAARVENGHQNGHQMNSFG